MKTLQVELPVDLVTVARLDQGSGVSKEAAKLIALELFREDKVSLGRAAELCHTPLEAFMDYAGKRGVPLHYGLEDLQEDWQTIERLGLCKSFPTPHLSSHWRGSIASSCCRSFTATF
jgi:predicted HTH domain antitoxin